MSLIRVIEFGIIETMDAFNFIKHTQVGKRFEERITVTRARTIGLPTQFYKDNDVANYKYVVLFYEKDKNMIGIKFTNEKEDGAIAIAKHNNGYGGYVSATSFFKINRINTKKYAGRYEYEKKSLRQLGLDEDGVLFIIKLQEKADKEGPVEQ